MAKVTTTIVEEKQLTILKVTGSLNMDEMTSVLTDLAKGNLRKNLIWDVTEGSVNDLTFDDMHQIAKILSQGVGMREQGKSALVAGNSDENFALARMFEQLSEMYELQAVYQGFHTLEEAREWIEKGE